MKHVFLLFAVTLGISSCASIDSSPGVPNSVLDSNSTLLHPLSLGANRIIADKNPTTTILASVVKFREGEINHGNGLWFGEDTDGLPRKTYLKTLEIQTNGHSLKWSESMTSPLVEPHWIGLLQNKNQLYLVIDGLDAGDSYRAVFTIEKGLVIQRLIAHGEFSHEIWERTIYHDDFDEHPERYKNM